jgi:hypothetical protein
MRLSEIALFLETQTALVPPPTGSDKRFQRGASLRTHRGTHDERREPSNCTKGVSSARAIPDQNSSARYSWRLILETVNNDSGKNRGLNPPGEDEKPATNRANGTQDCIRSIITASRNDQNSSFDHFAVYESTESKLGSRSLDRLIQVSAGCLAKSWASRGKSGS